MIPAIVVTGFISTGKSTLVHQLLQDKSRRYAFVFDHDVLPDNILLGFPEGKLLRKDVSVAVNGEQSICCTLDEENIESAILSRADKITGALPFDNMVFVSNSFESSFLAELLSCIDEGALSKLACKINLLNIVCLLDCASTIVNLKSTQLLKDRFTKEFEEVSVVVTQDPTDKVVHMPPPQMAQSLVVPLTQAQLAASAGAGGLSGSMGLSGSRKKTVCCPYQGEPNCCQNKKKEEEQQKRSEQITASADLENLVKKGDKPVCTLVMEQLTCASIVLLNKSDLVEEEEVQFLDSLVHLVNSNVRTIKTELSNVKAADLFVEPTAVVKNYQPIKQKMSSVFITHFYQRVPFHPERLFHFFYEDADAKRLNRKMFRKIVFLNGRLWLASDMANNYSFEVSPGFDLFTVGYPFYSTISQSQWPDDPAIKESIERDIKLFKYQDRKTEISIVGIEEKPFTEQVFIDKLTSCLLTEAELELGPNEWQSMRNPFLDILPVEDDASDDEDN
ncbi:hypothetical protein SAMD00019534_073310 [Acytostelium subglobosum LB1]|uniref:hypothetical protein n=1 Tax=Acytostelium subglobosum LB1 TaxID=1410327 RepID=UPI0006449432|nr:hypothetical protein SAMD00019534_073310 [Acytostelium subglobosum LB1]GAM24156.1 hypothetical protein SAMD00019534_073310 [Acytostelium subglobosum LB1]|eukprot:XP_012753192.1 hypothetical protein SAMD00019534_073310 [Acytostelium subglobosum LB1]